MLMNTTKFITSYRFIYRSYIHIYECVYAFNLSIALLTADICNTRIHKKLDEYINEYILSCRGRLKISVKLTMFVLNLIFRIIFVTY